MQLSYYYYYYYYYQSTTTILLLFCLLFNRASSSTDHSRFGRVPSRSLKEKLLLLLVQDFFN